MPRENRSTAGCVKGVNRRMKPTSMQTQKRIRKRTMWAGVGPGSDIRDLCYFLTIRGAALRRLPGMAGSLLRPLPAAFLSVAESVTGLLH
jgi:hypothetical protein